MLLFYRLHALLSRTHIPNFPRIGFPGSTHQGGEIMTDTIEQRACELAVYIIETGATVRSAALHFGISKSTVHKDDGVIIGTVKGNAKKH